MEDIYFDNNPKKTTFFYIALVLLLLLFSLSFGVDVSEFSQKKEINIPQWFFYLIFTVDFLVLASILAIFWYRKIGVIVFPIAVILHFFLHEFYLSTMLYSDLFTLFAYFAMGLLAVIPKWKFFK